MPRKALAAKRAALRSARKSNDERGDREESCDDKRGRLRTRAADWARSACIDLDRRTSYL